MSDLGNHQCDNCEAILADPADVICESCSLIEAEDDSPCSHEQASPDPEGCWWCHHCYTEVPSRKDW